LPLLQLSGLEDLFTEDEVRSVVMDLPNDKASGLDGFTGLFYKKAWDIIKGDIMNVFNAFWSQDTRSCYILRTFLGVDQSGSSLVFCINKCQFTNPERNRKNERES
jgi:hypothetical protein